MKQNNILDFLKSLDREYPGCTFSITPAIYLADVNEIRRGVMVRLPDGELRTLRHTWDREQYQDKEVLCNPMIAQDFETAMQEELRSAIRKEMKSFI